MAENTTSMVDPAELRAAVQKTYETVAREPEWGFHFHVGRAHALRLGYPAEWLDAIPDQCLESFAGTDNPFRLGDLSSDERVVDIGCGAGLDSLLAARMVLPAGEVIGVDMTEPMVQKARRAAREAGILNVRFRRGLGEELPIPDGWADVIVSNGVLNLIPDKEAALAEMARVLRPGGRLQMADIVIDHAVPEDAKRHIDLWTG